MDTYDLSIYQGQTFSLSLTLRDINGTPINLGTNLISGYLKTRYSDSAILADLNAQVANAASGIVTLGMSASVTAALPVNYSFYDVEMLNPSTSEVTKVLAGKASVYPEVSY